jgi:hypothetical protein
MAAGMRRPPRRLIVPPHGPQLFPHETFPPWRAIMRVFELIADTLARRSMPSNLKYLEVALIQASKRIAVVARGDLPIDRWQRRAHVAIVKLERAKMAIVDYVVAGTLDLGEAQALVDAIEDAIARTRDEIERVRLLPELREWLAEGDPRRLVH